MLEQVKTYLGISNSDKDSLIELLIEDAKTYAMDYCNINDAWLPAKFDTIIVKMVVQDYNRIGSQGISSQSYSGVSESFIEGYSDEIIKLLNKNRKLRCL